MRTVVNLSLRAAVLVAQITLLLITCCALAGPTPTTIEFSIDQGPFISDYHRVCRAAFFTPLAARKYCADKGQHWHSAHLAFQKVLPLYYAEVKRLSAVNLKDFTWYGSNDEEREGYWVYGGGRLDQTLFYWGAVRYGQRVLPVGERLQPDAQIVPVGPETTRKWCTGC